MVPSSAITVATDGECLTCGGFSFGETIHLMNFKFIADYFGGMSLSPRSGDSGVTFMGSTHSETPSPWLAMIEYSVEEFLTVSSEEGGFSLPSPKKCGTRVPPAPVKATPWMEHAPATQATMTVPLRATVPWLDIDLPFEQCHTHPGGGGRKCKPMLDNPPPSKRQCHGEASSLVNRLLSRSSRTRRHGMSPHSRCRES
jgi:hypothetical protein